MKYHHDLQKDGMQKDRALEVAIALHSLYEALNRLDSKNLAHFLAKPIETRLSEYALAEGGMRDVIAASRETDEADATQRQTALQLPEPAE